MIWWSVTQEELVQLAVEDLRAVFGGAVGTPVHALVIREKRATFSLTPESDRTPTRGRDGSSKPLPGGRLDGYGASGHD